jgi:Primase C terminal 1 (PriCT-1)
VPKQAKGGHVILANIINTGRKWLNPLLDPLRTTSRSGDPASSSVSQGKNEEKQQEQSYGVVLRGTRHRFLMSLADAGYENGVERAAILEVLAATNAEYCHPPKRTAELTKIVDGTNKKTPISCSDSGFDACSAGLIPRGERHAFLMLVAASCHKSGVTPLAILGILRRINAELCRPPKREVDLSRIVDWTGRNPYVSCRSRKAETPTHGLIPRGRRHHFLIALASTCHQNRMKPARTLEMLRKFNSEYCSPPKPESDLKRVVDWIYRQPPINRQRGRKPVFTPEQLRKAFEMKQSGRTNTEIAKVLYSTPAPTERQRTGIPAILNYHFGHKKPR